MDILRRVALFSVELVGLIIFFVGLLLMMSSLGFGNFLLPLGTPLFSFIVGIVISFIGIGISDRAKDFKIFKEKRMIENKDVKFYSRRRNISFRFIKRNPKWKK